MAAPAELWAALGGFNRALWVTGGGPAGLGPGGLAAVDFCLRAASELGYASVVHPAATATALGLPVPADGGSSYSSYDYGGGYGGGGKSTAAVALFVERWAVQLTEELEVGYDARLRGDGGAVCRGACGVSARHSGQIMALVACDRV
jgi:hypothetical protein